MYDVHFSTWLRAHGRKEKANMTLEEREMYGKIFEILDEDGSGALDFEEIALALRLVGMNNSIGQLKDLVVQFGNEEGELDFNAFLLVIENTQNGDSSESQDQKAREVIKAQRLRARRINQQPWSLRAPPQIQGTRRGPGPAEAQSAAIDGAGCAESDDPDKSVLPFHLFLPAFSRKKNVEFVMNLELNDCTSLPYPPDEGAVGRTSLPERDKQLASLRQRDECTCALRSTSLLDVANALRKAKHHSTSPSK